MAKIEWPKWLFRVDEDGKIKSRLFTSKEAVTGTGWAESPAEFKKSGEKKAKPPAGSVGH